MATLIGEVGPDTGLPATVEAVVALLFYAGPVGLAALGLLSWRRGRGGQAVLWLVLLAASIYSEAAFLDLACSPGEAGCVWIEDRLPVAGLAALLALAAAVAVALDRPRFALAAGVLGLTVGLYVTLGYLVQVA